MNDPVNGFKIQSQGENIVKRTGGSHQEQDSREAFRAAGWPISEPHIHAVEAGIDMVYGWHKQNRMFVFDDQHRALEEFNTYSRELDDAYWYREESKVTCRAMVDHIRLILDSDLACPIILSADGGVMDGMHRVGKALLEGRDTIEAVQFELDPEADYIDVKETDLPYE